MILFQKTENITNLPNEELFDPNVKKKNEIRGRDVHSYRNLDN